VQRRVTVSREVLGRRRGIINQGATIHESSPIAWLNRLRYINEPNMQTSIEYKKLQEDDENCFIEFDVQFQRSQYGRRARPLLRHKNSATINIPHSYRLSDALRTENPSSSAHSSTRMRPMGNPRPFLPQALRSTITHRLQVIFICTLTQRQPQTSPRFFFWILRVSKALMCPEV
jgi:hypothetical protein